MKRPTVVPAVIAEVSTDAPGRVRRKLDKNPLAANEWEWTQQKNVWTVAAGNETVEFKCGPTGAVEKIADANCSCLLSPRCFHLLACLAVLDVDDESAVTEIDIEADAAGGPTAESKRSENQPEASADATSQLEELSAQQQLAVQTMWQEVAEFLAAGARSAGVLIQSRLLRAIHECRAVGLHRLASAGLRVVHDCRKVRLRDSDFSAETLVNDLSELMRVARQLKRKNIADTSLIGTARRRYSEISNTQVQGLFCEPIHTRAGHSGIVTYVLDTSGQLASISNVRPGEGNRIQGAWKSAIDVGRLSMSHAELSQKALLIQTGTMSIDRRLGAGKNTRVAAVDGNGWRAASVRERFQEPLTDQVQRILAVIVEEPELWPTGFDLLFLSGTIVGTNGAGCLLQLNDDQSTICLVPSDLDGSQHAEDNLEILSRADGLPVDCIARLSLETPSTAIGLAFSPRQEEATAATRQMNFNTDWGTHFNFNLHRLKTANFPNLPDAPNFVPTSASATYDGLATFRQRLEALAIGGRHSLPTKRIGDLKREALVLQEQMQPTAAALMLALVDSAVETKTSFRGVRFPADPAPLAERWLACSHYARTASLAFQTDCWLG